MEIKKKVTQSFTIEKMQRNETSQLWHVNLKVEMPIKINSKSYSDLELIFTNPMSCCSGDIIFDGDDHRYTIEEVLKADAALFCLFDFSHSLFGYYLMKLISNHMTINKYPSVDYIKDPSNYYNRIDKFDNRITKELSFNFNFWEKCGATQYEFDTIVVEGAHDYMLSMVFQNHIIYGTSDAFFDEKQLINLMGIKLNLTNKLNILMAYIRNIHLHKYEEIPFIFDNYPILKILMSEEEFYNSISESFNEYYKKERKTKNDK